MTLAPLVTSEDPFDFTSGVIVDLTPYAKLTDLSVLVNRFATGGNGSSGNPWTGWDTAITWAANTHYHFPPGVYAYATAPNWAILGIHLSGEGKGGATILKHTGAGPAVKFDQPTLNLVQFVQFHDFVIQGNAATTYGMYLVAPYFAQIKNVRIFNATLAGFYVEAGINLHVENVSVTTNEEVFTTLPDSGFVVTRRASDSIPTNVAMFLNCKADGLNAGSGIGFNVLYAGFCTFANCTSQANKIGLYLEWTSTLNNFENFYTEASTVNDGQIYGYHNQFTNCAFPANTLLINSPANKGTTNNAFHGGAFNNITIGVGAFCNSFTNIRDITGVFSDAGTETATNNLSLATDAPGVTQPNTLVGRLRVRGNAPTLSGVTGIGSTGSSSIGANSTSAAGIVDITVQGSGVGASGTATITFAEPFIGTAPPVVMLCLMNNSNTWPAASTVQVTACSNSAFTLTWATNGAAITANQLYRIAYMVMGRG